MELFLENQKLDVESLRFIDWRTIALETEDGETQYTSDTGWDIDTGFELRVTKRKDED